jgi:hypothetical protein
MGCGDRAGYDRTGPVQVRNHRAIGIQSKSGPLLEPSLPVAGGYHAATGLRR